MSAFSIRYQLRTLILDVSFGNSYVRLANLATDRECKSHYVSICPPTRHETICHHPKLAGHLVAIRRFRSSSSIDTTLESEDEHDTRVGYDSTCVGCALRRGTLMKAKVVDLWRLATWLRLRFERTWSKRHLANLIYWRITRHERNSH